MTEYESTEDGEDSEHTEVRVAADANSKERSAGSICEKDILETKCDPGGRLTLSRIQLCR